ncbi:scavenger receptor class B member 1-like [Tropilaelaps mercedesae]|uniref:Scavenger receptor class B member 1 n=1 Tax=Tropilaelaps mercedesae TaxID=418985 RepID=A0A1V9XQP1_9ACAR|nr:scavenger receptor class B member 1-like [Tropilaelaps mercedesae]
MVSIKLKVALQVLAVVLSVFSLGLIVLSSSASSLVSRIAKGQANLESEDVLENFISPPVPVYQRIYMFNLTNSKEVRKGAKPSVDEIGPYVFRVDMLKKNVTLRDGILSFKQYKAYHFVPELSGGLSLQDQIITVNPILHFFFLTVDSFDNNTHLRRPLFFKKTVDELLYNGFEDDILDNLEDTDIPTYEGRVGYLVGTNNTIEGAYEVFSGSDEDRGKLNNIISFFGRRHFTYYEEPCNEVEGSNGELYPPFSAAPESIALFNPQLCRPWALHFNGSVSKNGLQLARFVAKDDFLSATGNATVDECLDLHDGADWKALFNAAPCHNSIPVWLSLPHFLKADATLLSDVVGLSPDPKKHEVYLDVYPKVGFTVDMRIRVQVNLKLKRGPKDGQTPEVIYPILWQEIMVYPEGSAKIARILYEKVELPRALLTRISVVLAVLCFIAALVCVGIRLRLSDTSVSLDAVTGPYPPNWKLLGMEFSSREPSNAETGRELVIKTFRTEKLCH